LKSAEGSGRTVEEAIREALKILGARREDVDLMVLDEGSRGVLGLGSRSARVRLTLLSALDEDEAGAVAAELPPPPAGKSVPETVGERAGEAQRITSEIIGAMGFRGTVTGREDGDLVQVSVGGPDLAPLIGRHGQTLEALDLLVNLIMAHHQGQRVAVAVDVERYRERRREALEDLARRFAERVHRSGRPITMKPMSAAERRIIHTTLADDLGVTTYSEGEEPDRRVVIAPRTGARPAAAASSAQERGSHPQPRDDAQ
jgi:spoIIIJ-associated protein